MSNESIEQPSITTNKRPKLVWVISIFYFFSVGWTLLSFALVYSGSIPLNKAQQTYFNSLTILDIFLAVFFVLLNIIGAIFLFALKRYAYYVFLYAFIMSILVTAFDFKNWIGTMDIASFIGVFLGWIISIAIILYTKGLVKKQILR